MTPGGEIRRIAQHTVGAPDDQVRNTWDHFEAATRAHIRLLGLRVGDGLHVPLAPAAHFGASPSGGEALDVEVGMRFTRAGRSAP